MTFSTVKNLVKSQVHTMDAAIGQFFLVSLVHTKTGKSPCFH